VRNSLSLAMAGVLLTAALIFVIADFSGGIAGFEPDWRWANLIALGAIAIWLAPGLGRYQGQAGKALVHVAIWLAIAVAIATIYVFRAELGIPIA
jgi:predicted aspartyl protease